MNEIENPYAAPETTDLVSPGAAWSQVASPELSKTALGLSLVYYGICLILLSMISAVFVLLFPPLMILTGLGVLAGALLMTIGPLFCLSVPSETGAKGLIVGAVICQLINVGATFFAQGPAGAPGVSFAGVPVAFRGMSVGAAATQLSAALAMILFVLFMRKLALYVNRHDLAVRARNVLILGGIILLSGVGIGVAMAAGNQDAAILMVVVGIMALVAFVMYANLVDSLRKALRPS